VREMESRAQPLSPGVASLFGPGQETSHPEPGDSQGILREVRRELQQALSPIVERFQANERREAIQEAHRASWSQAQEDWPELLAPASQLRSHAERFLQSFPALRNSADGPYLATWIARGYLAEAGSPATLQKKVASATAPGGVIGGQERDLASLQKEYDALKNEPKGVKSPADMLRMRQLRDQIRDLRSRR